MHSSYVQVEKGCSKFWNFHFPKLSTKLWNKIARGVWGQNQGPCFTPVTYLAKQLDPTIRGRPACQHALAAAALLTQESKKLTFEAPTVIRIPRDFKDLLSYKSMTFLSPSCIQPIHATLLECLEFSFERDLATKERGGLWPFHLIILSFSIEDLHLII